MGGFTGNWSFRVVTGCRELSSSICVRMAPRRAFNASTLLLTSFTTPGRGSGTVSVNANYKVVPFL